MNPFVSAAVSPAVVVPSLLGLQAFGYGVDQGVRYSVYKFERRDKVELLTTLRLNLNRKW